METVINNNYFYTKIYEKSSELSMIFEKDNKYIAQNGKYIKTNETYKKYVREYFSLTNLIETTLPTTTEKFEVGSTLINILNNKNKLISIFDEFKNKIIQSQKMQELKNIIIELDSSLKMVNKNFLIITYLIDCIVCELNLVEKEEFKKTRFSIMLFLNKLIDQLNEIENVVNLLFIRPTECYDDTEKFEELEYYSKTTYYNNFIIPDSNNFYKLHKYYPVITRTEYQISNLTDILYCTIYILAYNIKSVCKCKCCNKYFIPPNRNDTETCSKKCFNKNKEIALKKFREIGNIRNRITIYLQRHKKFDMLNTFNKRYEKKRIELKDKYTQDKYIEKLTEWLLDYETKHIHKK